MATGIKKATGILAGSAAEENISVFERLIPDNLKNSASYDDISFSLNDELITPIDILFNTAGTKMFILGATTQGIHQYTLTVAFDISSAEYDDVSYNVVEQDSDPVSIAFNNDGTKMYVLGNSNDRIFQYNLSIAYDLSTISYAFILLDVGSQDTSPADLEFSTDGTKMFMLGATNQTTYQYTLSEAFNVSTATYDSVSVSETADASTEAIAFNSDGTKMFVVGSTSNTVEEYPLSGAWDLSTRGASNGTTSVNNQETSTKGLTFSATGNKMYIVGETTKSVFEYTLLNDFTTNKNFTENETFASNVTFKVEGYFDAGDGNVEDAKFSPDGTKIFILLDSGLATEKVIRLDLDTAWDLSDLSAPAKAAPSQEFTGFTSQATSMSTIDLADDGSVLMMFTESGDFAYQYDLSTAWDLLTASYSNNSYSVSGETSATAFRFGDSGTKAYAIDDNQNDIYEYFLSTAYDLSTISFVRQSTITIGSQPRDFTFSSDGTHLAVVDNALTRIYYLTLSTAWDVSSINTVSTTEYYYDNKLIQYIDNGNAILLGAGTQYQDLNDQTVVILQMDTPYDIRTINFETSYGAIDISGTQGNVQSMCFNSDGSYLYIIGGSSPNADDIERWDLSTPYDVTTAVYSNTVFQTSGIFDPTGLVIGDNDTEMYILNDSPNEIVQFTFGTANDLTTLSETRTQTSFSFSLPEGLHFKPDGTKLYYADRGQDRVFEYDLTTAWDISSVSLVGTFIISSNWYDMHMSDDGTKLFVSSTTKIDQYNLSTAWQINTAASTLEASRDFKSAFYAFEISPDGHWLIIGNRNDDIMITYYMDTAYDIANAYIARPDAYRLKTTDLPFNSLASETGTDSIDFNNDGSKLFVLESANTDSKVIEYTTNTAYDTTDFLIPDLADKILLSSETTSPDVLLIGDSGSKFYVQDRSAQKIYQYDLTTPYDTSTASYSNNSVTTNQSLSSGAFRFSTSGDKLYALGASDTIYQYDLSTGWDLSSATYSSKSLELSGGVESFFLNSNGKYLIVVDTNEFFSYRLSTPWDISTAVATGIRFNSDAMGGNTDLKNHNGKIYYVSSPGVIEYLNIDIESIDGLLENVYDITPYNVNGEDSTPTELYFGNSGLKLYVSGNNTNCIYEYDLGVAYDITTLTYNKKFLRIFVDTDITDFTMGNNGTKLYVFSKTTDLIYEYDLGVAWDITSAEYSGLTFSLSSQDADVRTIKFNSNGNKLYALGDANNTLYQYTLSSNWDISSASYDTVSFDVVSQSTNPRSFVFRNDGTKFYVVDGSGVIYQYSLGISFDMSTASFDNVSFSVTDQESDPEGVIFNADGTNLFVLGDSTNNIFRYSLPKSYSLSLFFNVGNEDSNPEDIAFNSDGSKMYMVGSSNTTSESIYQYGLAIPYDITTASYDTNNFSVASQSTDPKCVFFNDSGSKMYVIDSVDENLYQYDLSIPYDITSASYNSVSLSLTTPAPLPIYAEFNSDGTRLYVLHSGGDMVLQSFLVTTPYDIGTASVLSSNKVTILNSQHPAPSSFALNKDESKIYFVSDTTVFQYDVSTIGDLTTATYSDISLDTSDQDSTMKGILFNSDGTKIYLLGGTNTNVYQYDVSPVTASEEVLYTCQANTAAKVVLNMYSTGLATININDVPRARARRIEFDGTKHIMTDGGPLFYESAISMFNDLDYFFLGPNETLSISEEQGSIVYYELRIIEDKS